jgi:hypothetical protein
LSLIFNEQKLSNIFFKDFKKQHTHLSCLYKKNILFTHTYTYINNRQQRLLIYTNITVGRFDKYMTTINRYGSFFFSFPFFW